MAEENIAMLSIPNENSDKDERGGSGGKRNAKTQKALKKDIDVDLFLLGKTGNGKSATGNGILMRKAFKSSGDMTAVTTVVDFNYTEFNGRVIKVVDVPGIEVTRENCEDAKNVFKRKMESAIVGNPKGYHTFLIVIKYSSRFTVEEVETIKFLKGVFGEQFVKEYCIIVMTCGDTFNYDNSSEGLSLKNWCDKQEGPFKELLQECSHRIVLYDNITNDKTKKIIQLSELLDLVDQLKGKRYTDEKFEVAQLAQADLIKQSEMEWLTESVLIETCLILEKLKSYQESSFNEVQALVDLLDRTQGLIQNLSLGTDKKSKLFEDVKDNVKDIKCIILLEVQVHTVSEECIQPSCSDTEKLRLEKALEETFENFEQQWKGATQSKQSELYDCINNRRTVLMLERKRQEHRFENIKSNYILTFVATLAKKINTIFRKVWNRIRM